jgi:FixJ family two-component response regulator
MLQALDDLLQAYDLGTTAYSSAEEFLARNQKGEADCLVLDINLDGMSGIDLRHRLTGSGCTLPVIFITAADDEGTRSRALAAGCVAYLRKPFRARSLIDAIDKSTGPSRMDNSDSQRS